VKFKEKSNPKAKDELETTLYKLPGKVQYFAIDTDNAKLIAWLKTAEDTYSLHIFDDFQPLLEHRQKLRQEFDTARSDITLSMYGKRDTNVPEGIIDIITDYALNPRP